MHSLYYILKQYLINIFQKYLKKNKIPINNNSNKNKKIKSKKTYTYYN